MQWLQILLAGGWIPQGKRTQWLGTVTIVCTLLVSLAQWGAGQMDFIHLLQAFANNWQGLVGGLGLKFVGDKVDARSDG